MDIRKMHITFHQLRQANLGNDYTHLVSESVDDLLNMSINDFIRLKTNNTTIQEVQSNISTEQYYEGLENLIRTSEISILKPYPYNDMGVVIDLHSLNIAGSDKYKASGTLLTGAKCKILVYNNSDNFTNVGGQNVVGDVFTVQGVSTFQPSNRSVGYVLIDADRSYITDSSDLLAGKAYTVLNGSITFAQSDLRFRGVTVDGVTYIDGQNLSSDLIINSGSTFIINDILTPTTWSNTSILQILNVGDEFYKLISSSSIVNYGAGNRNVLVQSPNRLYKSRDVNNYLAHGRGTVISSPISHMEGGELIVYQNQNSDIVPVNERFSINKVLIKYYKKPNIVSLNQNVDCDLNEIDHPAIVRKAVELSSAADVARNYQYIGDNNQRNITN